MLTVAHDGDAVAAMKVARKAEKEAQQGQAVMVGITSEGAGIEEKEMEAGIEEDKTKEGKRWPRDDMLEAETMS